MEFPNEIWVGRRLTGGLYAAEKVDIPSSFDGSEARYIHESRVPISCGGTMEEDNLVWMDNAKALKAVLTSGSAEEKEIIGLGPNLAKLKGIPSGRCSKHGAFEGSNCQECLKEICLTSSNTELLMKWKLNKGALRH
jgi:hypothetical protein